MARGDGISRAARPVKVDGVLLTNCERCRYRPIRETWLRACAACGAKVCRVCMDEAETTCGACRGQPAPALTPGREEG